MLFQRSAVALVTAASVAMLLTHPAGAAEPKRGGTLTLGLAQEPLVVDPIRTGSFTERQFAVPVYEALFDIDEKGNVQPFLAESFS